MKKPAPAGPMQQGNEHSRAQIAVRVALCREKAGHVQDAVDVVFQVLLAGEALHRLSHTHRVKLLNLSFVYDKVVVAN
jgi:hypothetical protein